MIITEITDEIAVTFQDIVNRSDFIVSLIDNKNLQEIADVCIKTIKYLTDFTLIFLQKIGEKWYVN